MSDSGALGIAHANEKKLEALFKKFDVKPLMEFYSSHKPMPAVASAGRPAA